MSVQQIVSRIVQNHRVGKETKLQDMQTALGLTRKEVVRLLLLADEQLHRIGYRLIPCSRTRLNLDGMPIPREQVVPQFTHVLKAFDRCDFVVIVKREAGKDKEPEKAMCSYGSMLGFLVPVFMLFSINCADLEYARALNMLVQVNKGMQEKEAEETLRWGLQRKYIRKYGKGEQDWIRLGWRYHAEFDDISPESYAFHISTKK